MKTYLLNTANRLRNFSETLDVSATLCGKPWKVFNDTGEQELYIFQANGQVFITSNGIGIQGTWQWIPANKSLIINEAGAIIMLHPKYIDDKIMTLTLDGTDACAFLIDTANAENFAPQTLAQLSDYFYQKQIASQKAKEAERLRLEAQRQREAECRRREAASQNNRVQTPQSTSKSQTSSSMDDDETFMMVIFSAVLSLIATVIIVCIAQLGWEGFIPVWVVLFLIIYIIVAIFGNK